MHAFSPCEGLFDRKFLFQFHLKSTGNAVNKLFELLSAMYAVVLGGILKHGLAKMNIF